MAWPSAETILRYIIGLTSGTVDRARPDAAIDEGTVDVRLRDALRAAAGAVGREPCSAPVSADAICVTWELPGEPALMASVLVAADTANRRRWESAIAVARRLRPPTGLRVPAIRALDSRPLPWAVHEAVGVSATCASLDARMALDVVLAIQRTSLAGRAPAAIGLRDLRRRVLASLDAAGRRHLLTESTSRTVRRLLDAHLERVREARGLNHLTAHGSLSIECVRLDGDGPVVGGWEAPVTDRLAVLDVARLIIEQARHAPAWAEQLGELTVDHFQRRHALDVRSNLVVACLERALGQLREAARETAEVLDAVLVGDLVSVAS